MKGYEAFFRLIKKGILKRYYKIEILKASEMISKNDIDEIKNILKPIEELSKIENNNETKEIFSFLKLESGNYCIIKCSISSIENTFAHAIIFNEPLNFNPIELIESNIFIKSLDELKENNLISMEIEITETHISREKIKYFLLNNRVLYLNKLLNAFIYCNENKKSIYIYDTKDNIILWITSLSICLPNRFSNSLTFTTDDLIFKNGCMISGTCNTSSDKEYIFDFLNLNYPSLEFNYVFSNFAINSFLNDFSNLIKFNEFIEDCGYDNLDKNIDGCLMLYKIIQDNTLNDEEKYKDTKHLKSAFEFASKNIKDNFLINIYNSLERHLQIISRSIDIDTIKPFSKFIFKTALNNKIPLFIDKNCYYFFAAIDIIAIKSSDNLSDLLNIYEEINNEFSDLSFAILKESISKERIEFLNALLARKELEDRSGFYLYITLKSLIVLGYTFKQATKNGAMEKLIKHCCYVISKDAEIIDKILKLCKEDIEYWVNIVYEIYQNTVGTIIFNIFIKLYIESINSFDENSLYIIRKKLMEMELDNLLFEECIERLNNYESLVEDFSIIERDILLEFPEFAKQYSNEIIKKYIMFLPSENIYNECKNILVKVIDGIYDISDDVLKLILNKLEDSIQFDNIDNDIKENITQIAKIKTSKKIKTNQNIIELLSLFFFLKENIYKDYDFDDINLNNIDIENLSTERYLSYLNLILPYILCYIKSYNDHRKIIRFLDIYNMNENFLVIYISKIKYLFKIDANKGYKAFLHFIIYFFYCLEPRYKLSGEDEAIDSLRNKIKDILNELSRNNLNKLNDDVKSEFNSIGVRLPLQWEEIYKEVNK